MLLIKRWINCIKLDDDALINYEISVASYKKSLLFPYTNSFVNVLKGLSSR